MRFHKGPFPVNKNFHPESEGWFTLPAVNLNTLPLWAIAASIGLLLPWSFLALLVFPPELLTPQIIQLASNMYRIEFPVFQIPFWPTVAVLIAVSILFIPIHELVHALYCPGWGLSADTVMGVWLPKGFLYVHYEGSMSRNRFLAVLIAPYIVLSLLPLALIVMFRLTSWTPGTIVGLGWLSLLGSLLAGGDLVSVVSLLSSKIPSTALIRNNGEKSYWKPLQTI